MKRQLKQFLQYQHHEQSNKYTQHISVCAIIFIMYTQSQKIANQIIEIPGIKKTKSGQSSLSKVTYGSARRSLRFICRNSLKIPKRWSESINRKKGQKTNCKMTNNDQQKSSSNSALSGVMFSRSLLVLLGFFFQLLYCLSFLD